jgi:hypothetical protein
MDINPVIVCIPEDSIIQENREVGLRSNANGMSSSACHLPQNGASSHSLVVMCVGLLAHTFMLKIVLSFKIELSSMLSVPEM